MKYIITLICLFASATNAAVLMPYTCMNNPNKAQPPYVICAKNCDGVKAGVVIKNNSSVNADGTEYMPSDFAPCKREK